MPGIPKPKKHWKKQNNIWRLLARPSHSPKPLEHCVFFVFGFLEEKQKNKENTQYLETLGWTLPSRKNLRKNVCFYVFSRKKTTKTYLETFGWTLPSRKNLWKNVVFFCFLEFFFVFQMSGPQNLHGASQGSAGGLHFLRLGVSRDMHCIYCVYIDHLVF